MTVCRKFKIQELLDFDQKHAKENLIGTDEAGRGPVAGPVVASAVCFKEINNNFIEALRYLDDSKRLSSKLRTEISDEIKKYSYYSIQQCGVEEIEEINILQASLMAMKKASLDVINQIETTDNPLILVDGKILIPDLEYNQKWVVKGDSKSASIAAASVLAKVARDDLMKELADEFPHYQWHKNKGYGTKIHMEAIAKHGITKWHRKSFLSKYI